MGRDERFTRRTRRPSHRQPVQKRLLVVSQGAVTEPAYLDALRRRWRLAAVTVRVHAKDPVAVVDWAGREAKRVARTGEPFDETWAIIDTECNPALTVLAKARALAGASGVRIAWSNPCFEVWLLLHRRYSHAPLPDARAAIQELERLLPGYTKDRRSAERLLPPMVEDVAQAIVNTERLRAHHGEQRGDECQANPSTSMDRLVRSIILLTADAQVDPLSLYLSLRDDPDDRTQIACEALLKDMPW